MNFAKETLLFSLIFAHSGVVLAEEEPMQAREVEPISESVNKAGDDTTTEAQAIDAAASPASEEADKLTAAQRKELEDQAWNQAAEEYNEQARSEADEVVCERVTITGSRQKKRVCRTVRDIEDSEEASKRMLKRSNRSGTVPAAGEMQGGP